ncbi:BURP domain protein USPL1 [Amborella trichopoda]|uniref:BURP domain-containing protein n=1 Tax=Amborella trichopoda TaxID=13333 RepID=U5D807_AMBTC|nr:BURP domain protein USPL1 [Amborella trichopoda]ERN17527.1 hypothetical protein AMTR_s00059p00097920 [Amborella trichopoda]|eukprot:XP_020530319.1 BURP domain protein USPL1 [Amborella trichopoda]
MLILVQLSGIDARVLEEQKLETPSTYAEGFDFENIPLYLNNNGKQKFQSTEDDSNSDITSHHHSSLLTDHSLGPGNFFFHMKDLKVGNKFDLYNMGDLVQEATSPLPRHEADSPPFAFASLTEILHHFSIPPDSPKAKKVAQNFQICESPQVGNEHKFCATSLESMYDFVSSILGPKAKPQVLATTAHNGENRPPLVQSYIVKAIPVRVTTPSLPVCHPMTYPYALYFCHAAAKTTALMVKLEGEDGSKIDAAAVCHLDTSDWVSNHVSFKVLGIKPGTEPVCHFIPENNFLFITNSLEAAM